MSLAAAQSRLHRHANRKKAATFRTFFKHCGDDIFLGVTAAQVREIAREHPDLPLGDLRRLMRSRVHEERSLAHAILTDRFGRSDASTRRRLHEFYLRHRGGIRDWDGVDDSAPCLVGEHLLDKEPTVLYELIESPRLWDRRIALVATLAFIRRGRFADTLKLTRKVLGDEEDLIHKAAGWMLREVGKRDLAALQKFLRQHHRAMPRTMLRYAIERFPEAQRLRYWRGEI
jgi:3-methyladenine DNA glycosylase AlkD